MKKLLNILLFTILCLTASIAWARPLDEIRRSGVVRVAFTQSGMKTVNLHLAKEFAKFLNCELDTVIISWNEIFSHNGVVPADYITNDSVHYTPDALRKADLICGTTYMYPWREKFFDFAGIMQVSDLLIVSKVHQRRSVIGNLFVPEELRPKGHKLNVKNYNDLKGLRIAIMENSSYEANLAKINEMIGGGIEIVKTKSEEESQELAKTGEVDGFVTISYVGLQFVKANSQRFKLAFPIAQPDNVAWAVEKGNSSLKMEIDNYFHTIKRSGKLDAAFTNSFKYDYASYGEIINSYTKSINSSGSFRDMDEIIESGKLIVALRDRDLVYHPSGQKQLNHYLAGELAKYLGLDLEIKIVPSLSSYFYDSHGNIVKDSAYTPETFNHIDIACDLLSPVDWRSNKIDIMEVMPTANVVIARKDADIKTINDLSRLKGVTSKGSVYEEDLIDNNISNYYYKEANEFFSEIIKGRADYTITNFDIYSLPQYPELEAKFVIGDIYSVGWGIRKNQPKLRQKILEFLESSKKLGIFNTAFLEQAGIPYSAAQNHIQAMYQTYQTGYFPFVFYGSDQGLPQEDVRCIFQDKEGYIWIGTHSGALKFNGRQMESYDDKIGLSNNVVFDIAQDSKGRMYFATLDGLSCLDENGEVTNYFNNVPLKHIYIDRKDNKYLYGDKGLYHLSSNNSKQQSMDSKVDGLPKIINSLSQNKSGRYTFICSPEGFFTLDRDNNKLERLCDKNCYSVFVEGDGMIWMSANDGVYNGNISQFTRGNIDSLRINERVSISNSRIHTIKQNRDESILLISDFEVYQIFSTKQSAIKYDQSIGLKNLKLLCFFEDRENNFWFGYRGGIQKLTNRSLRNLYPEVIDSYLNDLIEDANGRIWMAFNNKICYYQNHLVDFSPNLDGYNVPYVVTTTQQGDIFVADSYGIYIYDTKQLSKKQELKFSNRIYNLKSSFTASNGDIFLLTGAEGVVYRIAGGFGQPEPIVNEYTSFVSQMEEFNGMVIGGNNTGLVRFNGSTFEEICPTPSAVLGLRNYDGKLWVGTENGLGIYDTTGKLSMINIPIIQNISINSIQPARNDKDHDHLWLGTNKGFCYYSINGNNVEFSVYSNDGLPGNEVVTDGLLLNNKGVLYIATYHGVSIYDLRKESSASYIPECRLENLYLNGNRISQQRTEFSSSENNFIFELAGLSFKDEESITYEFFMKGLDNDFVASSGKEHRAIYQNLPAGQYEFVYRAKSKDNIWSDSQTYKFVIRKPFYATWWFILLMIIGTIGCIIFMFKMREKRLRERNEQLENTVRERTAEIQKQKDDIELKNEELEAQREEIMVQRNIATQQRDEIAQREKEIMDSIYYAKRIQTAIMPTAGYINSIIENFILFRPRDIVSGDFYYFKQVDKYAIIVAADCTGHGVPGAFMSMLGSAYINEIVTSQQQNFNTGHMLDLLRESIIESLKQTGRVDEAKDGMDIAMCILDLETRNLQFSGAFNPIYVVRNGEISEYAADRMPIGIHDNVNVGFTTHEMQMQKDDVVYIFSDGYASQFGGKNGRKIMTSRFKKILLDISSLPLEEQRTVLNDKIEAWMGVDYDQVDDILVMGFKVK